jgi:hypothetical protein
MIMLSMTIDNDSQQGRMLMMQKELYKDDATMSRKLMMMVMMRMTHDKQQPQPQDNCH